MTEFFEEQEEGTQMKTVSKFLRDEEALTTVEYAVAGGLVAAAVVIAFRQLGSAVGGVISGLTSVLTST